MVWNNPRAVKKSPLAKRGLQLMTKSDCLNCINGRDRWWPLRSSRSPNATATIRRLQKNWRTKCSKAALASGVKYPWHRIPTAEEARAMVDTILFLNQLKK